MFNLHATFMERQGNKTYSFGIFSYFFFFFFLKNDSCLELRKTHTTDFPCTKRHPETHSGVRLHKRLQLNDT